ncbi:Y4yA family PLP-dependent enzyme [Nocardia sp. alder85J]|uniref:Y4yA family PLP-dependent enzyme n=1 Tax=Nocardia sp. alder85J TaxID=2862949 RepID=UPI001CD225C5|nr:Y4yA family PLP-dependent enzyme [Nocardia sp. alder85J]MCX4096185.1 Y4yA family PLP-dependent enzyme [Nocardia sp. alder85J]
MGLSAVAQFSLWDAEDPAPTPPPDIAPEPTPPTRPRTRRKRAAAADRAPDDAPAPAAAEPTTAPAASTADAAAVAPADSIAAEDAEDTAMANDSPSIHSGTEPSTLVDAAPTTASTAAESAPTVAVLDPGATNNTAARRAITPADAGAAAPDPEDTPAAESGTDAAASAEIDSATPRFESPEPRAEFGAAAAWIAAALPAHADEWERRLLDDRELLGDIAFAVGGPFHVMYPDRVGGNIEAFRQAFAAAGLDGAIYYGKKANKAGCVVRACAEHGAGVDVASTGELVAALAHGVRGEDLMVTGPAKSDRLLWLAARHGALITVDEPGELDRLVAAGIAARVLLRVRPPGSDSRFGLTGTELNHAVAGSDLGPVRLAGFSFHLSGYEPTPRAELAAELIERCLWARDHGHQAAMISLGGGFGVDYVPAPAWDRFTAEAGPQWFHAGKRFDSYYPYHCPTPGAAMLATVLEYADLAKNLRDNGIRPAIEPGRALLDRAGSTVFRVQGSKVRSVHDISYQLLTVDGTSLSLSEQWFSSEYLPDPVLWPTRPGTVTGACVGAATCLESDMLSWRRIPLPRPATVGDLLVYPNTAGYQMDSNESAFHQLPIPPKVVLHEAPGGRLRWTLDAG